MNWKFAMFSIIMSFMEFVICYVSIEVLKLDYKNQIIVAIVSVTLMFICMMMFDNKVK